MRPIGTAVTADREPPAADLEPTALAEEVQANLGRAAKYWVPPATGEKCGHYRPRDWSLFLFFRILPHAEVEESEKRLQALLASFAEAARAEGNGRLWGPKTLRGILYEFAHPELIDAGVVEQYRQDQIADPEGHPGKADAPGAGFREWLKLLVCADKKPLLDRFAYLAKLGLQYDAPLAERTAGSEEAGLIAKLHRLLSCGSAGASAGQEPEFLQFLQELQRDFPAGLEKLRSDLTKPAKGPGRSALLRLIHYELLRQAAPVFLEGAGMPVLRSEHREKDRLEHSDPFDRAPITWAFTFSGLKALDLDKRTLSSFPDAFREGMAARASRLRDTGASAPESWEGQFGLKKVHGFFSGGSNLGDSPPITEAFWKAVRAEIAAFNGRAGPKGDWLRAWMNLTFRPLGLEIVQIELGQDPYEVGKDGNTRPLEHRVEHFGYRDGLSQPFVDLNLGDTLPGGGTPSRRGSWTPAAPGEIFLGCPDETGKTHQFPGNAHLRRGSTFLVFRKLSQDVYGFRAFLEQQRPNDRRARRKLGAQLVGRWENGTALVRSPEGPRGVAGEAEAALNDFRYAADDPYGSKCPLGAHIRRANPRDIGGRNDVRHHRILRRGMSFGGALLPRNAPDDGEDRGMLFVAANARIDVQFEVVQGEWLNGGEFLGQAGLGRCPLTGRQEKGVGGFFLEAGAVAPISGLPDFVTTRGGDYFFAPGLCALRKICDGDRFVAEEFLFDGHSMGATATPELFSALRIRGFRDRFLLDKAGVIRVRVPDSTEAVAFVGRHADVTRVLGEEKDPGTSPPNVIFSVSPYLEAGALLSRGDAFLVGTDPHGPTAAKHERLLAVLALGWETLEASPGGSAEKRLRGIARAGLSMALRRTAGARKLDLLDDLAAPSAYAVVEQLYGIAGPAWLTELAASLPFARQHVGELPPDWIAAFRGERPTNAAFTTMQIWMAIITAGLLGNRENQRALQALSRQAGSEALNHIDLKLAEFRAAGLRPGKPLTLAEAFVANQADPRIWKAYGGKDDKPPPPGWENLYYREVAIILLEVIGSTLTIVPLTFASVMTYLLDAHVDLPGLMSRLTEPDQVSQLIYEAERLNPNAPVRLRRCQRTTTVGENPIQERDLVAALIPVANLDKDAFPDPHRFSLMGYGLPSGPARDRKNYLLFGAQGGKQCWGRERVALPLLQECLYAAGRLQGLRRVPGARGEPQKLVQVTIGLAARFDRVLKAIC